MVKWTLNSIGLNTLNCVSARGVWSVTLALVLSSYASSEGGPPAQLQQAGDPESEVQIISAFPSPARGPVMFRTVIPLAGVVRLRVLDHQGKPLTQRLAA
jgi:hypothetical protein